MEKYYLWETLSFCSIFHFLFPMGIGYLLKDKWKYGIAILILFEILENFSGATLTLWNFEIFSPEPFVNIISDIVIGTMGLFVGNKIKSKK